MVLFFGSRKKEDIIIDMLANAIDKHNLAEIEYSRYGMKLRLSKFANAASAPVASSPVSVPSAPAVSSANAQQAAASEPSIDMSKAITSPMVGVVYLAPNPSAPVYVKKGDKVKVGDILCLVEAMKTFNPVKADRDGVVKEILVKESQSVEYAEPLFIIE